MSRRRPSAEMRLPLPSDRLWRIGEAAHFFGMGEGWVREHVPAVILPGEGERRAVRYLPQTCYELARQLQTSNTDLVSTTNTVHAA